MRMLTSRSFAAVSKLLHKKFLDSNFKYLNVQILKYMSSKILRIFGFLIRIKNSLQRTIDLQNATKMIKLKN